MSGEVKRKRGRPRGPTKVKPVSDFDPHAPHSEEHKRKISEGLKRAYAEGRKVISDEQREALRQSMMGHPSFHSPEGDAKYKATRKRNKELREQGE